MRNNGKKKRKRFHFDRCDPHSVMQQRLVSSCSVSARNTCKDLWWIFLLPCVCALFADWQMVLIMSQSCQDRRTLAAQRFVGHPGKDSENVPGNNKVQGYWHRKTEIKTLCNGKKSWLGRKNMTWERRKNTWFEIQTIKKYVFLLSSPAAN